MGAERFDVWRKGDDIEKAHYEAIQDALFDYGHRGYTGTIAEKHEVVLRETVKTPTLAEAFANKDLQDNDHDKWGPTWAVRVEDYGGFLFYGYASS